jgi:trans-aconitate 2-methyltransferase
MTDWSPSDYLKFADERVRPAMDLLQRVDLKNPALIYDLGCGPGNSTELLLHRYASAKIVGVDKSPAMIDVARKALPSIEFELADLETWTPRSQANLLFSNATFQWLPNHVLVMQRLLKGLQQGGVLAVQMPDNLSEPSHVLMQETANDVRWKTVLQSVSKVRAALLSPSGYYDALKPYCSKIEIWHSVYNHNLENASAIRSMFQSTGLTPFLEPLDVEQKQEFLDAYEARLKSAYPEQYDGTVLLQLPRLFVLATV